MTPADIRALAEFKAKYPTWWWKVGWCDLTRDFDAAPQGHSPEAKFIRSGNNFDDCFSCDHPGSVADAIYDVIEQINEAIRKEGEGSGS